MGVSCGDCGRPCRSVLPLPRCRACLRLHAARACKRGQVREADRLRKKAAAATTEAAKDTEEVEDVACAGPSPARAIVPGECWRHVKSGQVNVVIFVGRMRCHETAVKKPILRWLPSVTYRIEGKDGMPLTKRLTEFLSQCVPVED